MDTARNVALVVVAATAGVVVATVGAPVVVGALGFGAAGITKGTIAASMMASHGGAVPAGSVVAVCQSIGATGAISTASSALGGACGGAVALATRLRRVF